MRELQQDKNNVLLCEKFLGHLVNKLSSLKPHRGRCENQVVLAHFFLFAACSITLKDVLKLPSATSLCCSVWRLTELLHLVRALELTPVPEVGSLQKAAL